MDEYRYWKENYYVKLFLNAVKVQMAIDSGASANIIDEGRSKERFRLEKSKGQSSRLYVETSNTYTWEYD